MAPVRRFISCTAYDVNDNVIQEVIPVTIHLDGQLLRDMATAARQDIRQNGPDIMYQIPQLKLTQRDTDKVLSVVTEYLKENDWLLRTVSSVTNESKSSREQEALDEEYANHSHENSMDFDRNGWKGKIFVPRLVNQASEVRTVKYSGEQVMQRELSIDYEEQQYQSVNGDSDLEEKPLKLSKKLNLSFEPLMKIKDGFSPNFCVTVYVQQRPSK